MYLDFHLSSLMDRGRRLAEGGRGAVRHVLARGRDLVRPTKPAEPVEGAAPTPGRLRRGHVVAGSIGAGLVVAIAVLFALWDWDWFKAPLESFASARTHRAVHIDGHLRVKPWSWTPQVAIAGLRVSNPSWAGPGDLASIPMITARVRLLPLLAGRLDMTMLEMDRPDLRLRRDRTGRANWIFDAAKADQPLRAPPIEHLVIRDGRVDISDAQRRLHLSGVVQSSESASLPGGGEFRLTAQGLLNAAPIALSVTGGPLVHVRRDRPYHFDMSLRSRATTLLARGIIDRPFDFGVFHASVAATGQDLADIYDVTGLAAPNSPPYSLKGQLSRDGAAFSIKGLTGRVGDSDVAGSMTVTRREGRKYLEADLVSRSLDIKDFMAVLGGGPVASKAASPQQKAEAHALAGAGRVLPDAPLRMERLRAMDADVRFRATAVKVNALRLTAVRLGVKLRSAVLSIDPVQVGFARGTLNGKVRIDGRGAVPVTEADLRLSGYALESILPQRGGVPPVTGVIGVHARLHGAGLSVHEAASHASGTVSFAVPHGEMRQAFAELLGVNVGRGLFLLLSKDERKTELRCAAGVFDVSGGTMRARSFVIDTGVVVSHGSGTIDLNSERLNLKLDGKSKKPRLLRLWVPITVKGPLSGPRLGVDSGKLVKQGGLAAVGALVQPLVALIPFLTPGGARDTDCAALLASAQ